MNIFHDETLQALVREFVGEMPGRIATLEQHRANDNWDGLQLTTHRLAGAGGAYGFPELSRSASALEIALRLHASVEVRDHSLQQLLAVARQVAGSA